MNNSEILAVGRGNTIPIVEEFAQVELPPDPSERHKDFQNMVTQIDDAKPEIEGNDLPAPEKKKPEYLITEELFEEEKERIDGLNFLALAQYKRSLESHIEDVESTLHMIETLEKMKSKEGDLGTNVAIENIMSEMDLATKEEMQTFKDNFPQNMKNLNRTLEYVKELEEALKGVKKTSTYMNDCMLEVLAEKTKVLKEQTSSKFKKLKIYYNNVENVYKNRDSMEFLMSQVKPNIAYVKRVVDDINKANKNGRDITLPDAIRENVVNAFTTIFKVEQMRAFEHYVSELFEDDGTIDIGYVMFLYQYLLYIIYKNEKQRHKGYHKWVEALIMNVLDIQTENYDLPKDKEMLNQEIKDMILLMVENLPKL